MPDRWQWENPTGAVSGVDAGSLSTPSYVAWLWKRHFLLDIYIPSVRNPLPQPPADWPAPVYIAFDIPQGLPTPGRPRRKSDEQANTPTRKMPTSRKELGQWRLYRGFIEAGVEIFWAIYAGRLGSIAGLSPAAGLPNVVETYPRYVIARLWPELRLPSKSHAPLEYIDAVWTRIRQAGYSCASVIRPTVDQVDAMVCALAAEACMQDGGLPQGIVGCPPIVDPVDRVLREGYIVSP